MKTQIDLRPTVDDMIAKSKEGLKKIEQAVALMKEADELFKDGEQTLKDASLSDYDGDVYSTINDIKNRYYDALKKLKEKQNISMWRGFIKASPLWNILDHTARSDITRKISAESVEFNYENALSTYMLHHQDMSAYFRRGLITTFSELSNNLKSNDSFSLKKKIIIDVYTVDKCGSSIWSSPKEYSINKVRDIERAFHIIDGKPFGKNGGGTLADKLSSIRWANYYDMKEPPEPFEDEYFHVKIYKNGSTHLTFKRPDLVKKLNLEIAAYYGNALGKAQ